MNDAFVTSLIEFNSINGYYTIPIMGIMGILTNLICLSVFYDNRFKERKKFQYVILKVFIDTYGCVYAVGFQNFLQCLLEPHVMNTNRCVSTGSLYFIVWRMVMYKYTNYMFYVWY